MLTYLFSMNIKGIRTARPRIEIRSVFSRKVAGENLVRLHRYACEQCPQSSALL